MAKIAFIQNIIFEYLGLMYISSILKNRHTVEMFLKHRRDESLLKEVLTYQPDIVAFSCTTGVHKWCLKIAALIKNYNPKILTLFGGPHPTFFPEIVNESTETFFLCYKVSKCISPNKKANKITTKYLF